MTEKKKGGNVREGDIRENNPARKARIEEVRQREADEEMKEYQKEWKEMQGRCREQDFGY